MKIFILAYTKFKNLMSVPLLKSNILVSKNALTADFLYILDGSLFLSKVGLFFAAVFIILKKKVIIHWIGTDVLSITEPTLNKKRIRWRMKFFLLRFLSERKKVSHFAAATHLKYELEDINIESNFVPVPGYQVEYNVSPLPSKLAALTYVPEGREEFYGLPLILELARSNPEMDFFIVAHSGYGVRCPVNVHFYGWVNRDQMDGLYDKCSCILRLTKHDALAGTVLEGVARGRYALWTYPSQYTMMARTFDEAQNALNIIKTMTEPNEIGARAVASWFSSENLFNNWKINLLREISN